MPLNTKSKGHVIIHSFAVGAATWSALTAWIPVVGPGLGDTAGLTAITIAMTYSLAGLFNKKLEEGSMWAFGAVVVGTVFGTSLLKASISLVPILGSAVNATITFALHEATGWALYLIFEEGKDPTKLSKKELKDYIKKGKEKAKQERDEYEEMTKNLTPEEKVHLEKLQKSLGDKEITEEKRNAILKEIEDIIANSKKNSNSN